MNVIFAQNIQENLNASRNLECFVHKCSGTMLHDWHFFASVFNKALNRVQNANHILYFLSMYTIFQK